MTEIARRRLMQATVAAAAATTGTTISSASVAATQPDEGDWMQTNNEKLLGIIHPTKDNDFNFPYKLLLPQNPSDAERPLCYEESARGPGNYVTSTEELVSLATEEDYHRTRFDAIFEDREVPVLVPLFPTTPNDGSKEIAALDLQGYQQEKYSNINNYPSLETIASETEFTPESLRRVDKQLVAMIEHATELIESTQPYSISGDGVYMFGFSSGSNFVDRFAFLHPEYVDTYAIGGTGFSMLPMDEYELDNGETVELPYPLGTADYEALTGHEFDFDTWQSINKFIFVGENDTVEEARYNNLPTQTHVDKLQETVKKIFGMKRVETRFATTREIYNSVDANATFTVYSNLRHNIDRRVFRDMREFYTEHMDYRPESSTNSKSEESTDTDDEQSNTDDGNNGSDTKYAGYWLVVGVILGLSAIILKSKEEGS